MNFTRTSARRRKQCKARRGEPSVLFHLSRVVNLESILCDGLRANEGGDIFAFTDMVVANTIALNQVFAERYAVFAIDPKGVTGKVRLSACSCGLKDGSPGWPQHDARATEHDHSDGSRG
jgi:hypothetical protein